LETEGPPNLEHLHPIRGKRRKWEPQLTPRAWGVSPKRGGTFQKYPWEEGEGGDTPEKGLRGP